MNIPASIPTRALFPAGDAPVVLIRRGFTLIELLVTMFIIAILVAITMSFVGASNRWGALDSGINEVSASLTFARAIAMRDGTDAGVVFFRDPGSDDILLRIVKRNSDTTANQIGFADVDDKAPTRLPAHIRIAGLNPVNGQISLPGYYNYSPNSVNNYVLGSIPGVLPVVTIDPWTTNNIYLLVWFGPNGAIRTNSPSITNGVTFSGATPSYYYDSPPGNGSYTASPKPAGELVGNGTPVPSGILQPIPFIAIFDYRDAQDAIPGGLVNVQGASAAIIKATVATNLSNWIFGFADTAHTIPLQTKARILTFNRYTGQLIKNK